MRRAKIVVTLGPATSSSEQIRTLVDAGMDVARLNLSHGNHEDHRKAYLAVREASDASGHDGPRAFRDYLKPRSRHYLLSPFLFLFLCTFFRCNFFFILLVFIHHTSC